jgi:hypothetical protein
MLLSNIFSEPSVVVLEIRVLYLEEFYLMTEKDKIQLTRFSHKAG